MDGHARTSSVPRAFISAVNTALAVMTQWPSKSVLSRLENVVIGRWRPFFIIIPYTRPRPSVHTLSLLFTLAAYSSRSSSVRAIAARRGKGSRTFSTTCAPPVYRLIARGRYYRPPNNNRRQADYYLSSTVCHGRRVTCSAYSRARDCLLFCSPPFRRVKVPSFGWSSPSVKLEHRRLLLIVRSVRVIGSVPVAGTVSRVRRRPVCVHTFYLWF